MEIKSWLVKPPIYDCAFGQGKCSLRHLEEKIIDCIFKNEEYCPWRDTGYEYKYPQLNYEDKNV